MELTEGLGGGFVTNLLDGTCRACAAVRIKK